jgi:hypothetical protein
MLKNNDILENIVSWAEKESSIRSLILTGSRAGNKFDELSEEH